MITVSEGCYDNFFLLAATSGVYADRSLRIYAAIIPGGIMLFLCKILFFFIRPFLILLNWSATYFYLALSGLATALPFSF